LALKKLSNATNEIKTVVPTWRKVIRNLCTREEMIKAEDMGISIGTTDNRDLNYSVLFGGTNISRSKIIIPAQLIVEGIVELPLIKKNFGRCAAQMPG
jgi:hypothetical protein